jgi:hypothetical protein
MRIMTEIALLVGTAAVALASPIACPDAGPPMPPMPPMPPKPKGVNEDLAVNVASVGNCPVRSTICCDGISVTDRTIDQLLERGCCESPLRS